MNKKLEKIKKMEEDWNNFNQEINHKKEHIKNIECSKFSLHNDLLKNIINNIDISKLSFPDDYNLSMQETIPDWFSLQILYNIIQNFKQMSELTKKRNNIDEKIEYKYFNSFYSKLKYFTEREKYYITDKFTLEDLNINKRDLYKICKDYYAYIKNNTNFSKYTNINDLIDNENTLLNDILFSLKDTDTYNIHNNDYEKYKQYFYDDITELDTFNNEIFVYDDYNNKRYNYFLSLFNKIKEKVADKILIEYKCNSFEIFAKEYILSIINNNKKFKNYKSIEELKNDTIEYCKCKSYYDRLKEIIDTALEKISQELNIENLFELRDIEEKMFENWKKINLDLENPNKSFTESKLFKKTLKMINENVKLLLLKKSKKDIKIEKSSEILRSNDEEIIYNKLKTIFKGDIKKEYISNNYPWHCDFYIPKIDTYIEYQGYMSHGFRPFDKSKENLEKLLYFLFKSEYNNLYKSVIKTWCISDVAKRTWAKKHNLKWLEFFNIEEFNRWINDYENKDRINE